MATAFTTTVTAIPVLLDGALTNPMEYVSFVLLELLSVLLELQSTTVAVIAVVAELSTTIRSAKLYLEVLAVVFTLTLVLRLVTQQLLIQGSVHLQMVQTQITLVLLLGREIVEQMLLALYAKLHALTEEQRQVLHQPPATCVALQL